MNDNELNKDVLNNVTGGEGEINGVPGMTCPQCGGFVPVSVSLLMHSDSLCCPTCGLRFDLKGQNSYSTESDNK